MKLLVLDDYEGELAQAPAMARLRALAEVTILDKPLAASDFHLLREFHALFALRERTRIDQALLDAGSELEIILQSGGHAYHVDQEAATRRGIVVALGRRVTKPTVVVPELAFGLMLGLLRQICAFNAEMKNGGWPAAMGGSLAGRTLGILGYGRHGRPVAKLARAFGMKIVAWDRSGAQAGGEADVLRLPLDELLAISDVVSIHLRLSDESRGLVNGERLAKMKPGAILINTARGEIVDEAALIDALRAGRLAGAGLDVFAREPLAASSPLRTLPNVLLTPHIGWKVRDVLHEFVQIATEQLDAWLKGALARGEVLNPAAINAERKRHGGLAPG